MVYIQKNVVSPNKVSNLSLIDFSGGLNNRSEVLNDNESSDLLNMVFTNGVVMEKRKGQRVVGELNLGKPITYIDEFKGFKSASSGPKWGTTIWGDKFTDMSDYLVVATDDELYINGVKVSDVSSKVQGISHQNNYYFVDGNKLKVYGTFPKVNSTYISVIGDVPVDNTLLTVVTPPEGYIPLGDSIIIISTIREETNSDISVQINNFWYTVKLRDKQTLGDIIIDTKYFAEFEKDENQDIHYVTLYTEEERKDDSIRHLEGVLKVDYTNKNIWYEPCEMEIEDEYKGANVVPNSTKYIISHKGRIFTTGDREDDDNIFISDVENPYYFPVSLPIQIPPDSDKIVGLVVYDDSIIIGRKNDIYALSGETNRLDLGLELFNLRKLNTHTGFANNTCANHVHNYLFFIGSDGNAYSLSSSNQEYRILSTQLLNQSIDLFKEPIYMSYGDIREVVTYFYDDNWYVSIEGKVLVYSYRHRAWTMFDGYNARSFYTINDDLHWGNTKGQLVTTSRDYLDFGEPFYCFWSSKYFNLDEPSLEKHFKQFNVIAESYDHYNTDLYVQFNIDHFNTSDINKLIPFNPNDKKIDNVAYMIPYNVNKRGRNIRFTFTSGIVKLGVVDLFVHLQNYPRLDGTLVYVRLEDTHYMYHSNNIRFDECGEYDWACQIKNLGWVDVGKIELNQPMKIYEVNFNYEFRGGRN